MSRVSHRTKEGKNVLSTYKITSTHSCPFSLLSIEVGEVFPQNIRFLLSDPCSFVCVLSGSSLGNLLIPSSVLDPQSFKWVKFLPSWFFFFLNKQSLDILQTAISFLPLFYKFLLKLTRLHDSFPLSLLVFGSCPHCYHDTVLVSHRDCQGRFLVLISLGCSKHLALLMTHCNFQKVTSILLFLLILGFLLCLPVAPLSLSSPVVSVS